MMVVRLPPSSPEERSEVYTIDFRETAPAAASEHMYSKSPLSARYGGLAVGVPGELLGFEEAHKRWGKLPWADLFQPAIDLAYGWEVDRELGRRLPVSISVNPLGL
jgi:gamma-glutamyltranspeptidase / glutathione hydrolase / leukotriene-C4 hydrolase